MRIAWSLDPANNATGMAHATEAGQSTSLCGIDTPFLDGPWPQMGEEWSSAYCRCAACARRLDASRMG